jgi:hypothetical protein
VPACRCVRSIRQIQHNRIGVSLDCFGPRRLAPDGRAEHGGDRAATPSSAAHAWFNIWTASLDSSRIMGSSTDPEGTAFENNGLRFITPQHAEEATTVMSAQLLQLQIPLCDLRLTNAPGA